MEFLNLVIGLITMPFVVKGPDRCYAGYFIYLIMCLVGTPLFAILIWKLGRRG